MHQTQFSEIIPYRGLSQIRSQMVFKSRTSICLNFLRLYHLWLSFNTDANGDKKYPGEKDRVKTA